MRTLLSIIGISFGVVAPALAEEPTTLEHVTTKGVVMKASGFDIPVTYTPDGKFTAMNGMVTGSWRIDGDKMCSISSVEPKEACIAYPAGKKPGDQFDVAGPAGPMTITINP